MCRHDLIEPHVELFSHTHGLRRVDTLPHLDGRHGNGHSVIRPHMDESIQARTGRDRPGGARGAEFDSDQQSAGNGRAAAQHLATSDV